MSSENYPKILECCTPASLVYARVTNQKSAKFNANPICDSYDLSHKLAAAFALSLNSAAPYCFALKLISKQSLPRSADEWRIAAIAALGKAACPKPERQASQKQLAYPLKQSLRHEASVCVAQTDLMPQLYATLRLKIQQRGQLSS